MQVQVDGVPDAVEVDVLVHVEAGVEEGAQRAERALVEREAVGGAEGVVDQPVDVDGAEAHAAHPRVAAYVVEVVDGDRAGERAVEQADPARDGVRRRRRSGCARGAVPRAVLLRAHQEGDVPRVDGLAGGELPRRASPQLGQQRPELADDEVLRDLLVVDAEHGQQVLLVAEVAEGAVAEVVQEAGHAQRLLDQRLRRRARLDLRQRGVDLPRQLAGEVHGAEAVREAAVLGGGEHPPRALQLVDALEALDPRVVDHVRLRDLARAGERDAQVAVQRVGDEVDVVVGELHRPSLSSGPDGDKDGRRPGAAPAASGTSV